MEQEVAFDAFLQFTSNNNKFWIDFELTKCTLRI